jgi:anaphase-promoting complex subunit 10
MKTSLSQLGPLSSSSSSSSSSVLSMYAAPSDDTEAPPQPEGEGEGESSEIPDVEEAEEEEAEEEEEEGANTADATGRSASTLSIAAVPNLDSLYGLREIGRDALCWQLSSAKPGNGVEQIRDQSIETYWQSDGTSQPHWLQVHFARRVAISHVCLYLDYNLDESYTPKVVRVECGMTNQDLTPAVNPGNSVVELSEPAGWCIIPLQSPPDPLDDDDEDDDEDEEEDEDNNNNSENPNESVVASRKLVRAHLIRISVDQMHQNGRDTHIRQVQLYGPRRNATTHQAVTTPLVRPVRQQNDRMQEDGDDNGDGDDDGDDDDAWTSQRRHHWEDEFTTGPMMQFSMIR